MEGVTWSDMEEVTRFRGIGLRGERRHGLSE